MHETTNVAVIVGSLRKGSFNRLLANEMCAMAPPPLSLQTVEIGSLPLYSQDLDEAPPGPWTTFRERIRIADAVLFVTPEYNRSVPGVLKNAIDVGSRPYGQNVWNGKPGAVVSASPGAIGGFGANHHLRQSLVFLNVATLAQPEVYLGGADKLFDGSGRITQDAVRAFIMRFLNEYERWIATIRAARGATQAG